MATKRNELRSTKDYTADQISEFISRIIAATLKTCKEPFGCHEDVLVDKLADLGWPARRTENFLNYLTRVGRLRKVESCYIAVRSH